MGFVVILLWTINGHLDGWFPDARPCSSAPDRSSQQCPLWVISRHLRCKGVFLTNAKRCFLAVFSSCGRPMQVAQGPLPKQVNGGFAFPIHGAGVGPQRHPLRCGPFESQASAWTSWKDILDLPTTAATGHWKQSY